MIADPPDIIIRLKAALPTRWFPDHTPTLDLVLAGLATTWSAVYALLQQVRSQSRIATATGAFLDGASGDYFGPRLPRHAGEADDGFRSRIALQLKREHATRAAIIAITTELTGHAPVIFEPARVADTGAYANGSLAFGSAGAWGSLSLPFQAFVTVRRAQGTGVSNIAGYGSSGPLAYSSLDAATGQVTDADIYAAIASVMPTTARAWARITN